MIKVAHKEYNTTLISSITFDEEGMVPSRSELEALAVTLTSGLRSIELYKIERTKRECKLHFENVNGSTIPARRMAQLQERIDLAFRTKKVQPRKRPSHRGNDYVNTTSGAVAQRSG